LSEKSTPKKDKKATVEIMPDIPTKVGDDYNKSLKSNKKYIEKARV
jgi:hypothetical protein